MDLTLRSKISFKATWSSGLRMSSTPSSWPRVVPFLKPTDRWKFARSFPCSIVVEEIHYASRTQNRRPSFPPRGGKGGLVSSQDIRDGPPRHGGGCGPGDAYSEDALWFQRF